MGVGTDATAGEGSKVCDGVCGTWAAVTWVGGCGIDGGGGAAGWVWSGTGACGVLGLELLGEAAPGSTTGDWEPEDGLWPLEGAGEP